MSSIAPDRGQLTHSLLRIVYVCFLFLVIFCHTAAGSRRYDGPVGPTARNYTEITPAQLWNKRKESSSITRLMSCFSLSFFAATKVNLKGITPFDYM